MDRTTINIKNKKPKTTRNPKNPSEVTTYLDWALIGKANIFRYMIGFVLILVFLFVLSGIAIVPLSIIYPDYDKTLLGKNLLNLVTFIIPFLLIPLMVKLLHNRPYWSVGLPTFKIEKWNLAVGFLVSLTAGVTALIIANALGYIDVQYTGFNWGIYVPLIFIGVVGIFIQASTEEITYRGYFAQFVRRFTSNPIIIILITTYSFASPHMGNISQNGSSIISLTPYLIDGAVFGWVAYRTKSLWMSIGLHWSSNLALLLVAGSQGDVIKSAAPFQYTLPSLTVLSIAVALQAVFKITLIHYLLKHREAKSIEIQSGQF